MKIALLIVYLLFLIYTVVRILLDTTSTPKTLAYLLLVMVFPVAGILLYFSFGINYRHQQSTSKGAKAQLKLDAAYQKEISNQTENLLEMHQKEVAHFAPIVHFLGGISNEHLSQNKFKLLVNGEEKFPEVLKTLDTAQHFIHMEYYD